MSTAQFATTREEAQKIDLILKRAFENRQYAERRDRLTVDMDLCACHANGMPLDFDKLLKAPEFDFWHDVCGISEHIDRNTGAMLDCFVPRCAR